MTSEVPGTCTRERLLNRRQMRQRVPVSDMTIWRWEAADLFPRHLTINGRNYWRESELNAWLEARKPDRP